MLLFSFRYFCDVWRWGTTGRSFVLEIVIDGHVIRHATRRSLTDSALTADALESWTRLPGGSCRLILNSQDQRLDQRLPLTFSYELWDEARSPRLILDMLDICLSGR